LRFSPKIYPIKALCAEVEESESDKSSFANLQKYLIRAICWFVVLGFTALLAWLVYVLLDTGLDKIFEQVRLISIYIFTNNF